MRNEITQSDTEIEEAFDDLGCLIDISDIVFTRDTLDDFRSARKGYSDGGRLAPSKDGTLVIYKVQPIKGQPRQDLVVIDYGSVRAAYLG